MQIKELHITNFRSLKDLKTPGLASAVVFHGANNSGKSNILLALQTIFSAKSSGTGVSLPQDMAEGAPSQPARTTPFWNGVISDFGDNFYMGTTNVIDFTVRLEVMPSHFEKINEVNLLDGLLRPGHNYQVKIVGKINRLGTDGEIVLETVHLNNKFVFNRQGENVEWLSWIDPAVDSKRKQYLGEALLNSFTNSVYVVPANRYLSTEKDQGNIPNLESSSFKNWLHQNSLSREGFSTFEAVRKQLKEPPFDYGDISFVRDGESIDIMVDDGCGFRMSIAQKGTGVHQILVLLGYIVTSRAHVVGIEEPELNLSFQRQDDLITTLLEIVRLNTNRVSQILLSSHSDHVGSRSELKQIRVENPDGRATTVRKFTLADRAALFPRSNKGLKRKIVVR